MSDPESGQRTPRSSSSTSTSGTGALGIKIDPEPVAPPQAVDDEAAMAAPPPDHDFNASPDQPELSASAVSEPNAPEPTEPLIEAAEPEPIVEEAPQPGAEVISMPEAIGQASAAMAEQTAEFIGESIRATVETARGLSHISSAAIAEAAEAGLAAFEAPSAPSADPHLTQELRAAIRDNIVKNETEQEALQLFEEVSRKFAAAFEEAGQDAARVTMKLMEFAQANLENNLALAQDYAAARSVPEVFDVQAAFLKRQFAMLTSQVDELRELTGEMTSKTVEQLKSQKAAITQRFNLR